MAKAFFYIYETANLPIVFNNPEVLDDYAEIMVSISQKNRKSLHISEGYVVDREHGIIYIHLSQEDTSGFKVGTAEVQVNIKYLNSERDTSAKTTVDVYDNLYKEVM